MRVRFSATKPFILRVGTGLIIPSGINIGKTNGNIVEIPLRLVSANVYDFIAEGSVIKGEVILSVPRSAIQGNGRIEVCEVDFRKKSASAKIK